MIAVISDSAAQVAWWAQLYGVPRSEFRYIRYPKDLRGRNFEQVEFVGPCATISPDLLTALVPTLPAGRWTKVNSYSRFQRAIHRCLRELTTIDASSSREPVSDRT